MGIRQTVSLFFEHSYSSCGRHTIKKKIHMSADSVSPSLNLDLAMWFGLVNGMRQKWWSSSSMPGSHEFSCVSTCFLVLLLLPWMGHMETGLLTVRGWNDRGSWPKMYEWALLRPTELPTQAWPRLANSPAYWQVSVKKQNVVLSHWLLSVLLNSNSWPVKILVMVCSKSYVPISLKLIS